MIRDFDDLPDGGWLTARNARAVAGSKLATTIRIIVLRMPEESDTYLRGIARASSPPGSIAWNAAAEIERRERMEAES